MREVIIIISNPPDINKMHGGQASIVFIIFGTDAQMREKEATSLRIPFDFVLKIASTMPMDNQDRQSARIDLSAWWKSCRAMKFFNGSDVSLGPENPQEYVDAYVFTPEAFQACGMKLHTVIEFIRYANRHETETKNMHHKVVKIRQEDVADTNHWLFRNLRRIL